MLLEVLYTANIKRNMNGLYFMELRNRRQNDKLIWTTKLYKKKAGAYRALFNLPILDGRIQINDLTNEDCGVMVALEAVSSE